jgi:HD-GYP domain-containing protein (c-di-GMP phosphodiesterase class II)
MSYTLLYPKRYDIAPIQNALESSGVIAEPIQTSNELALGDGITVFLLDPTSRVDFTSEILRRFVTSGGAIVAVGAEGEEDIPEELGTDLLAGFLRKEHGPKQALLTLRTAYREAAARADCERASREAETRSTEVDDLTSIGMALATERDYNALLDLILVNARRLTSSDAGSLYLVEGADNEKKSLRFKLSTTYSRPEIPLVEFTMPLDKTSIAGFVAITGDPLVIDDAYFLPPDSEYTINRSIDKKYGYRTKSMLTIPMADHKNEVIGVLQLINRKLDFDAELRDPEDFEQQVIPYTRRLVHLVRSLAGQAAVSIENSQLYEDIERLFEGFVRASVTAIEQRDPTTSGHSGRVADKTVGLAEVVDRVSDGQYRRVSFSREEIREIRYAGLLHDFGKVGVREQVLVKSKKLYPPDMALVRQRYAFIRLTAEQALFRQRVEFLEAGSDGYDDFKRTLEEEFESRMNDLDRFMQLVLESNEPTVLPEGNFDELLRYAEKFYSDLDGKQQPYLSDDDVRFLSIRKGSLDNSERLEIESHVTHTYKFLLQIPWTKELSYIPTIAYGHHEKLNGGGYPRRIKAKEIPIQARMMTIADIFDALTASDRPYKRAVPTDRALDIISYEVKDGMIDSDLFDMFVEAKIFEREECA